MPHCQWSQAGQAKKSMGQGVPPAAAHLGLLIFHQCLECRLTDGALPCSPPLHIVAVPILQCRVQVRGW